MDLCDDGSRSLPDAGWPVRTLLALLVLHVPTVVLGAVQSFQIDRSGGRKVPFFVFLPENLSRDASVLVLVPGYNGSGRDMLDAGWTEFAEREGLVLLAPTFETNVGELRRAEGYYYPEQWSGAVVEAGVRELERREGVDTRKILIYGMSAGAHFAHRFALWKPESVKAFVACSAGWWSEPTEKLSGVPALIMCGESDPRYRATLEFFDKAIAVGLPWVWRSYRYTGHDLTPAARRMAEVFLAHYAKEMRKLRCARSSLSPDPEAAASGKSQDWLWGDRQTYRWVGADQADEIPPAVRVKLPSKEVAEVWEQEE